MKVMVTGATGLGGAAIVRRLLREGDEVHALRRTHADGAARTAELATYRDNRGAEALDGVRWFEGDVGDPRSMAEAAAGCEVFVHAARETSREASRDALGWINVAGTENALKAARHARCKRFIHIGCVDVTLANTNRVNWNEDKALAHRPTAPHALTEFEAEDLVIGLGGGDLDTVVLRCATLWGEGDRRLLPRVIREARAGGFALVGNGENLVATCHADNLAEAVKCTTRSARAAGALYHVTDDELTLARDFYGGLCEAAGLEAPTGGKPYRLAYLIAKMGRGALSTTDVILRGRSTSFDISPARNDLGYEPIIHMGDGMKRLAAWIAGVGVDAIVEAERGAPAPR